MADPSDRPSSPPAEDSSLRADGDVSPDGPAKRTEPKRHKRRWVLQAGAGLALAGVHGAGGYLVYDNKQRFGRDATKGISDHRVAPKAGAPRMVVAHGADAAKTVRAAFERMGGLQHFLSPDDVVLVKPNIGWNRSPDQGANTHPEVVAEVVRACRDAKVARVIVSDCPVQNSRRAFKRSGIHAAASQAGAEVIVPEESRFHTVKLSERLGSWEVLEPFVEATKIINVPVAKHNSLSGVTAGMKNWIGITLMRRMSFHADIHNSIAELAALMRPTLTVIDASRVLMRNGPQGGNIADVKTVGSLAVSTDPVALDAWTFELLGQPARDLPEYLRITEGMGLGRIDFRSLDPVQVQVG